MPVRILLTSARGVAEHTGTCLHPVQAVWPVLIHTVCLTIALTSRVRQRMIRLLWTLNSVTCVLNCFGLNCLWTSSSLSPSSTSSSFSISFCFFFFFCSYFSFFSCFFFFKWYFILCLLMPITSIRLLFLV